MTKAQKVFEGIFYYVVLIAIIAVIIYIGIVADSYFNGYNFFMSYHDGWDAAKFAATFLGVVLLIFEAPLILYIVVYLIYMKFHPACKTEGIRNYLKNWKFYLPVMVVAGGFILWLIAYYIDYFIPKNETNVMKECLDKGLFYEVEYQDSVEELLDEIHYMDQADVFSFFEKYDPDAKGNAEELIDYIYGNGYMYDDYFMVILPAHKGKTESIELTKMLQGFHLGSSYFWFDIKCDDSEKKYVSVYLISRNDMVYGYLYEENDVNAKMHLKYVK